jgi:hypothetical protein
MAMRVKSVWGKSPLSSRMAQLQRVRAENANAKVVEGLGAVNIPFVRQFGGMGLEASPSSDIAAVELEGAIAALRKFDQELTAIDRRLDVEEAATKQLRTQVGGRALNSREVRKQGLLNKGFGVKGDSVNLGPIKLGKSGPKLNMGLIRNAAGRAFTATIAAHLVASAMDSTADAIQEVNALKKKGASNSEITRAAGGSAARGFIEGGGNLTGIIGLLKGINRLSGKSAEQVDQEFNDFFDRMFLTREELGRRKTNRAVAAETAARSVREKYEKLWEKIAHTPPQGFMLGSKREAAMYRRDIRKLNLDTFNANRSRDEAKARDEAMANAQGGI